jgi:hypothetical protein
LLGLAALGLATVVEAQGFRVTGRALHVAGGDSTALRGEWAVLHRVGAEGGAPVDSQRTTRTGRYTLTAPTLDSVATYLVSVRFAGINYFGEAFRASGAAVDSMPVMLVYDTSSTSPPIELVERHVIIRSDAEAGGRRAIELIVITNRGDRTRVAPDTSRPVWQVALPENAANLEFGAGELNDQAIIQRGDTLGVLAALPPGERQFLVGYLVPPDVRELLIPIDQFVERLSVLVEDTDAEVVGVGVTFRDWEELEGVRFRRFAADSVGAGTPVSVRFAPPSSRPFDPLWIVVPLVSLMLLGGVGWWWRGHRGRLPVRATSEDPERLAAQISALDARFAGRETDDYRRHRAELKARLKAALARRGGSG